MYYNITYNITQDSKQKKKPIDAIGLTYQIDDIKVVLNRKGRSQLRYKTQICF